MDDRRFLLPAFAALLAACSSGLGETQASGTGGKGATSSSSSGTAGDSGADAAPIGGDRPVEINVPPSYKPGTPMPLVLMLHGYSATADLEELYLQITPVSNLRGFIYARANGTVDKDGQQFWNATDACCNLYGSTVDDSSYLSSVITEIEAAYTIDPKQVYLFGHSNGGFMSYRMACDHADQVTAIVSLAGAMWEDTSKCNPSHPVSILEIHGTADTTIAYNGGTIGTTSFPSAPTTVSDWVTFDDCSTTPDTSSPPLDLDSSLPGAETTVTKYGTGCKPGGHAELWTITGGMHIPNITPSFTTDAIQFLYDHPRP
jgi:polyhydroxybutyrate depolymerase